MSVRSVGFSQVMDRVTGAGARRLPLYGSWELTYRCNLTCGHCWVNLPASDAAARRRELALPEIQRITDEVVAAGCLWMLLTGGEVTIRRDFTAIYRHMKQAGLILHLYTNGTTITGRLADFLAEWPPGRVEISLYGITKATYRAVTGVPALERCLRGIRLLLDRKIKVTLKSVVTKDNYDEYLRIRRWVIDELGLREFRYDPNLNYRKVEGRDGVAPVRYRVAPERIVELDLVVDAAERDLQRFYRERLGPVRSANVFTCGAGVNSFHIDPYGRASLCMTVPSHTFDLRERPFRQVWERDVAAMIAQARLRGSRCDTCAIASACDNCPGWSVLEHGEFEHPNDFLCELNHRRAEVFAPAPVSEIKRKETAHA
jgi:radical SAM protein with 4Fe4S-binding SPASM domain